MLIKILCPCGTKFAFDVEPVQGRMPMAVACPECGADATELANTAIAQQLAPAAGGPPPAEPPRVRIRTATAKPVEATPAASPAPPPAPAAGSTPRIRLAGAPEADANASPAPEAQPQFCTHHPTEPVTEHCRVCGKPICPKCMELFGYVCSVYCRGKAEREKMELPRYAQQRSVIAEAARAKARLVMISITAVLAVLFAGWVWWAFFGTKPRVVWSAPIPRGERGTVYELLSPTEILAIKERQLVLHDIAQGKDLWTTPLESGTDPATPSRASNPAPAKAAKKSSAATPTVAAGKLATEAARAATGQARPEEAPDEEEDEWDFRSYGAPDLLTISGGNIWIQFPDRLAAYDRQTGARKQEVPLRQPLSSLVHGEAGIVAVSGDDRGFRTITWVALPSGTVKTEQVAPAAGANAAPARSAADTRAVAAALGVNEEDVPELEAIALRDDFLPAGANVVAYRTRLVEHKTVWRSAMKPKPEKSIVDSGRLSAGQSLDAVQELMNDMARSGGGDKIEEDVSRYQVTLRRLLGTAAPEWRGEVIGPPSFFPLKTVDVVFGAKQVIVLDKANQKRWEATNIFNMPRRLSLGLRDEKRFPCVETADALYVSDQGMLTCFELATGQARWRLTSVGISRVQFDDQGKLYVNTTTASPDVIDFPKQINIFEKVRPVIMKVDPATGQVLWKISNMTDECILSGEFVYAARSSSGLYGSGTHFNLYRLNPSNGKELWNYYQERWPRNTGYHGNHFMLQWKDEVQVLKFLTL
jgi:outer membrane protein assembly factor BamB